MLGIAPLLASERRQHACLGAHACVLDASGMSWPTLAMAWSWLHAHERSLPPLKSLFSNSPFILRRQQSSLSRNNAPITICPLTLHLIPSYRISETFIQLDHACALLLLRSSHGCKATHEALHIPIPDLGLEEGHTKLVRETINSLLNVTLQFFFWTINYFNYNILNCPYWDLNPKPLPFLCGVFFKILCALLHDINTLLFI